MQSKFEWDLSGIEREFNEKAQQLEKYSDEQDIQKFIQEIQKEIENMRKESDRMDQESPEIRSFLSSKVFANDKEIVTKRLASAEALLAMANSRLEPKLSTHKESATGFMPAKLKKSEAARKSSLGSARSSYDSQANLSSTQSRTTILPQQHPSLALKSMRSTPLPAVHEMPVNIPDITIDQDMNEIEKLFKQAVEQDYKQENADAIFDKLMAVSTKLFLQIRGGDVVNPKRHKEQDSTDYRYSDFANTLFKIVHNQFEQLDVKLKELRNQNKIIQSEIAKGKKMTTELNRLNQDHLALIRDNQKLITVFTYLVEKLVANHNNIALMGVVAPLGDLLDKYPLFKNNLPKETVDLFDRNMKYYRPNSTIAEDQFEILKSTDPKVTVIPHIGNMKYKFVYIDQHLENIRSALLEAKEQKMIEELKTKEQDKIKEQAGLEDTLRKFQNHLATAKGINLIVFKLQFSEDELKVEEKNAYKIRELIDKGASSEELAIDYERLIKNQEKRKLLLKEQYDLINLMMTPELVAKLTDIDKKRNNLLNEMAEAKTSLSFIETKLIVKMPVDELIKKYGETLPKQFEKLTDLIAKLADNKIPMSTKINFIKEAEILMKGILSRSGAISLREKEIMEFKDTNETKELKEQGIALIKLIEKTNELKDEFLKMKTNLTAEQKQGRSVFLSSARRNHPNK